MPPRTMALPTFSPTRLPPTTPCLLLNLVGHKSNRDGIGAVVKLTTSSGSQYVTATTASSYQSSSERVHFGMGKDDTATIEIRWPAGIVQTLKDVKANQILKVDEPAVQEPAQAKP